MEINKPISAAIILIITTLIVFLFVMPAFDESSRLQKTIFEKEGEYLNKSMYYEGIAREFASIEMRRDMLLKVENALPAEPSFAPIVYFLQQKGIESGVAIKSLAFSDIASLSNQKGPAAKKAAANKDASKVKTINFDLGLVGTYQGLKNFLVTLENSARIFEVDTITFASSKPAESVGGAKNQLQVYDFTLQIKTFTY